MRFIYCAAKLKQQFLFSLFLDCIPSTCLKREALIQPTNEPERLISVRRAIKDYCKKHDISFPKSDSEYASAFDLEAEEESEEELKPDPIMAEVPRNRPLREYAASSQQEPHNSITAPTIDRRDFELKPSLISAIQQRQFFGNPTEDPNEHLTKFVQFADIVIAHGVTNDALRLRLFPFSLRDRARAWLQSLSSNSITSWEQLNTVFLAKYFPPSKNFALRAQINGFRQKDTKSLYDAWERFKDMMRMCPHHGLENWIVIHTFYNGLLYNTRLSIDAAAGGTLMDKPYDEAYQLIKNMAQNHYQWGGERTPVEKSQTKGGMYEISSLDKVTAKVDALAQKLDNLTIPPAATVAAVT